ncbi:MAG: hypothetical protein ABIA76_02190 [Candidatus Diapherotrites archaeon]
MTSVIKTLFDTAIISGIAFCIVTVIEAFFGISFFSGNFIGIYLVGAAVFWSLSDARG